jgi:hypothetical protein
MKRFYIITVFHYNTYIFRWRGSGFIKAVYVMPPGGAFIYTAPIPVSLGFTLRSPPSLIFPHKNAFSGKQSTEAVPKF